MYVEHTTRCVCVWCMCVVYVCVGGGGGGGGKVREKWYNPMPKSPYREEAVREPKRVGVGAAVDSSMLKRIGGRTELGPRRHHHVKPC